MIGKSVNTEDEDWVVFKDRLKGTEFKDFYAHGIATGPYKIVTVLAAAKAAGMSTQVAVDIVAREIPWRRDALGPGKADSGAPIQVDGFFEVAAGGRSRRPRDTVELNVRGSAPSSVLMAG